MPKRYEDEINEILHKFDDWPPSDKRARRPRQEPPHRDNSLTAFHFFDHMGPQQLMALGLVLILIGVVLRFGLRFGLDTGIGVYATAAGCLLLVVGYIMAVVRGGGAFGQPQRMWRGQVIDLHPSNRGLGYWWWRLRANLRNRR